MQSSEQVILNGTTGETIRYFADQYKLPIDVEKVVKVVESGQLVSCTDQHGGASLLDASICNTLASLLVVFATIAMVNGLHMAFLAVDKAMLCKSLTDYLKGILGWWTHRTNLCNVYAQQATTIKQFIEINTGITGLASLANAKSAFKVAKSAVCIFRKSCCDATGSKPVTNVASKSRLVRSGPQKSTARK